jgi:hypothetical protein
MADTYLLDKVQVLVRDENLLNIDEENPLLSGCDLFVKLA